MHSRAKAPTKAERARMARIVELGCVACRKQPGPATLLNYEVHHLTDGGVRRGHAFTVCLCMWHHRGVSFFGNDVGWMTEMWGPSFFHDAREFRARYGSDDELLAYQNQLLMETGK